MSRKTSRDKTLLSLRNAALVSFVMKVLLGLATVSLPAGIAFAHDIPTAVVVQAIVKPQGQHLDLLVRVPLEAMRDVNFPETAGGYLHISAADERIRDAAKIWVAQEMLGVVIYRPWMVVLNRFRRPRS